MKRACLQVLLDKKSAEHLLVSALLAYGPGAKLVMAITMEHAMTKRAIQA